MRYSDRDMAELIAYMLMGMGAEIPDAPQSDIIQQDDAEYISYMKNVKIYGKKQNNE